MRHAVLGVGGIGGLLAGALARAGHAVVVIAREETVTAYPGRLKIESAVLGNFEVEVPMDIVLSSRPDAVWITTKAVQLNDALVRLPPESVGDATVVPLLNGIEHLDALRRRYRNVIAASIRVESSRPQPYTIRQVSPFIQVELSSRPDLCDELRSSGIPCRIRPDELTLLWEKLAFLAPLALATSALDQPLGGVRRDERYEECRQEVLAVARAEGAQVDEELVATVARAATDEMRTSMQRDIDAARAPELDAIAGPVIRGGRRHRISTPATASLVELIERRVARFDGTASNLHGDTPTL